MRLLFLCVLKQFIIAIEFGGVSLDMDFFIKQWTNCIHLLIKSKIDLFPAANLKEGKPTGFIAKYCIQFDRLIFRLHKAIHVTEQNKLSDENSVKDCNKKFTRII